MATIKDEYAHWRHKNNEALDRIALLESQVATVRRQCEEQRQQESVVTNLKRQLKRYSLIQNEYMSIFSRLNLRTKRPARVTGLSETTTFATPDVKASIAVKQLTAKIEEIMKRNLKGEDVDDDLSGISEPILALLRSSSVEPSMILDQMRRNLEQVQTQAQPAAEDVQSKIKDQEKVSQEIRDLEMLCEERQARADENLKKQQALKYQADELVRQIKCKIASNYPDAEIQRMLLKYILSKAQKQRYHTKVKRLQQIIMEFEQEQGSNYDNADLLTGDLEQQMNEKLEIIDKLHIQIDELNLKILQQLEQNKNIGGGDEKRLWDDIRKSRSETLSKFQKAVDMVSNREIQRQPTSEPMDASSEIQAIRRQLHLPANMGLGSILREVERLKAQAHVELDAESICNEACTISKEKLQTMRHGLASQFYGDASDPAVSLLSAANTFTECIQQQQAEFWKDHQGNLQQSMQQYKQHAINSIQQIHLCINERNKMLQGELVLQDANDPAEA